MTGSRRPFPDGNSPQRATTSAIHSRPHRESPANTGRTASLCTRFCTFPYGLGALEFRDFRAERRACDGRRGWRWRRRFAGLSRRKEGWRRPRIRWVSSPSGRGALMTLAVALHRGVAAVCQVPTSLAGLLSLLAPCFYATDVSDVQHAGGRVRRARPRLHGDGDAAGRRAGRRVASQPRARLLRAAALGPRRARAGAAGLPGVGVRQGAARRSAWPSTTRCSGARGGACGARTTCTTAPSRRAPGAARAGATAGSSSCSSSSFRAWAAGRSGCRSCSGCSGPRTTRIPTGRRSPSWPGR